MDLNLAGLGMQLVSAALRSTPAAHSQQHQRSAKLAIKHAEKSLEETDVRRAFMELEFAYQFLGVMRANDQFFKQNAKTKDRETHVLEKIVEARESFFDRFTKK